MKVVVLLFLLIGVCCESHQVHAQALWQVSDEDSEKTLYLFGTMHFLDSTHIPMDEIVYTTLNESDTVYLELSPADEQKFGESTLLLKYAMATTPLKERVSADAYEKVQNFLESHATAAMMKDIVDTWMLALTITSLNLQEQGFSAELGAETLLVKALEDEDVPVLGLETVEFQLSLFDNLSAESQEDFLLSTIDEASNSVAIGTEMATMWREGDVDALADFLSREFADYPDLEEILLTNRNQAWFKQVESMMSSPSTVFIAVGAGHLVGEGSLISLLKNSGYTVKRIN